MSRAQADPSPSRRPSGLRRYGLEIALGLGLVLLTVLALGRAGWCEFVNYDDDVYVTNNLDVQGGLDLLNIPRAFTSTISNHWHPLTWLSLMLDAEIYGLRPLGFHLTNLVLHTANVLLLFGLLRQMTGAALRSAFVAALFAVHPLHVESVAWVTERKDVLSTFFWLLATIAYVHYARRPAWRRYLGVVLLLALGLMAKPMLMTMPLTLLLLDFWPLRRLAGRAGPAEEKAAPAFAPAPWWKLLAEKVPLLLLAAGSALVSLYAREEGGGLKSGDYLGLPDRLAYAVNAYVVYLEKLFWPRDLALLYPLTPGGLPAGRVALAAGVLVLLTVAALALARRWPYLAVGWLWYLVTLLPVSGIVQLGSYALADRYTYVPSIGLFLALVWGAADLVGEVALARLPAAAAGLLLVVALALGSHKQVGYWQDSISLWEHAQAVTPDNFVARTKLGEAYERAERIPDALTEYAAAAGLRSDQAIAHANLARCLLKLGREQEGLASLRQAAERERGTFRYRERLVQELRRQGKTREAEEQNRILTQQAVRK
jgi:hypothetical protein